MTKDAFVNVIINAFNKFDIFEGLYRISAIS